MPLHDWTRVAHNVFHTFQYGWLWNLAGALNGGVLPAGYVARPEEYVGPYESDVLTLETSEVESTPTSGELSGLEPVLTLAPPLLSLHKQRRITVYSARGERRVAVIEVVSPGNKDSRQRRSQLETKLVDYLESGLQLTLIDVLPSAPAAGPLAGSVARRLGAATAPALGERHAASFAVQLEPPLLRLYAQELHLGQPLPPVPLFLTPEQHVRLPLEESYCATLDRLPAADRALL